MLPELASELPEVSSNWAYIIVAVITAVGGWLVAKATHARKPSAEISMHPIHAQMLTDIHRETIEISESMKSMHRRAGSIEGRLSSIEKHLPARSTE